MKHAVILICLSLAACGTPEQFQAQVDTFYGKSFDNVVVAWGPPAAKTELSNGFYMARYERMIYAPNPMVVCAVDFVVRESDHIVVGEKTQGKCLA